MKQLKMHQKNKFAMLLVFDYKTIYFYERKDCYRFK